MPAGKEVIYPPMGRETLEGHPVEYLIHASSFKPKRYSPTQQPDQRRSKASSSPHKLTLLPNACSGRKPPLISKNCALSSQPIAGYHSLNPTASWTRTLTITTSRSLVHSPLFSAAGQNRHGYAGNQSPGAEDPHPNEPIPHKLLIHHLFQGTGLTVVFRDLQHCKHSPHQHPQAFIR